MFEISTETRRMLNLVIPFSIGGWVFYSSTQKGKSDWKNAGIMAAIVLIVCYIVVSQITRVLDPATK